MPPAKQEKKYDKIYRARVTEVDVDDDGEKNKYGAVRVYIPELMSKEIHEELDEFKDGILAYPSNMGLGGYNEDDPESSSHFAAANVFIPLLNSYVRVMFEDSDMERAFYLGPWQEKAVPLPAVNRNVDEPHKVYTVITSGMGRSIVVCDSPDQQRVEITGKKRKLDASEGPAGNAAAVYEVDGNQTVILIDEREGSEKLIIKTHKGDYINFDIEKQTLECKFKGDIMFETEGKFQVKAKGGVDIKTDGLAALESKGSMNMKSSSASVFIEGKQAAGIKTGGKVLIKGQSTFVQTPLSCPAKAAQAAKPAGER
jgi:hypothetical protein